MIGRYSTQGAQALVKFSKDVVKESACSKYILKGTTCQALLRSNNRSTYCIRNW